MLTNASRFLCASTKRKVSDFIRNVDKAKLADYLTYWRGLEPRSHLDYYHMWLFAFMSIHTTWRMNVYGFEVVSQLPHKGCSYDQLSTVMHRSRTGLHNFRARALHEFMQKFWDNPSAWYPLQDEPMAEFRNRAAKSLYGIGLAKTSFLLEMAFPATCGVVCLDTHILQLYGAPKSFSPSPRVYDLMEKHWCDTCRDNDVPSAMVRHIYWDGIQKQNNTRYWSYVLEKRNGRNTVAGRAGTKTEKRSALLAA